MIPRPRHVTLLGAQPPRPRQEKPSRTSEYTVNALPWKSGDPTANTYTLRQERRRQPTIQSGLATSRQVLQQANPLLPACFSDTQDSLHESTAPAAIRAAPPLP